MHIVRRILGILVMIAGIMGLLLSLAGFVGVWLIKPDIADFANTTFDTLRQSVVTSQNVMGITEGALGATIDSVDALSEMLGTTAAAVEETQPVIDDISMLMEDSLPATLGAATDSLYTAQDAARVLESTIQSFEAFRLLLSAAPLIGDFAGGPGAPYNPEVPLADSLGEVAANLEGLPDTFIKISTDLSSTDDNLAGVQGNLVTMSESVALISASLGEYKAMIVQSQSSMNNLNAMLVNLEKNLSGILNWLVIGVSLFLVWLLAAQVVILSQGWELYQGTASRLESREEVLG